MAKYIDVHHHLLPSFYRDALNKAGVPQRFGITLPPWTIDFSKDLMDKYNITAAITSISTPGVCIGDEEFSKKLARQCNEYAANLTAKYPKTYGGFATLPLPHIDATVNELTYALDVLKMEGVTLLSIGLCR